ncbi:MAG: LPS export ABC transporter periplasmic protein LptC [Salinivirgaceae bacterium]|nr:LPS export ABC transporter periplasmic protein LptC [Salinivirgaceae bacterium]
MKQQKLDFNLELKTYYNIFLKIKTPFFIGVLIFFASCKNDIQEVKEITSTHDTAIMSAKNIEMHYTTNGINNMKMISPLLNRYLENGESSYSEFPKGLEIFFYDEEGKVTSSLKANYSIYFEKEGKWEAKYDVEAINEKGEKLNTEYLVWLSDEHKIYSDQFVKVTNSDGIIYGDGFESNEDFTSWEVINGRGVINIETDE